MSGTLVIGGGVVGKACALALRRAGESVTLLDPQGSARPASYGNAGHIATEQVAPLASPAALASAFRRLFALGGALDFRLADIGAWGPWAARFVAASTADGAAHGQRALSGLLKNALPAWRRLAESLGRPDLLIERGHVVVWESAASARAGRAAWEAADIGQARLAPLAEPTKARLEQLIQPAIAGGVAFQNTGQVSDPALVLRLLDEAFDAAGGRRRVGQVRRLANVDGRVVAELSDGQQLAPERVLVAGGVGSGALMRGLGHVAPIIAERGYHLEGGADHWDDLPPVVFEDRSLILTRFGDRLRAASFVEFGREASPADPRKWARLRRHLSELDVSLEGPVAEWMGARPTLPDYLPAIGASRRVDNLYYAFGHQHLGLTLAATTGERVAALVGGAAPATDLAPFDLARFERGWNTRSNA
ncbi:NAD(P)/FAD-dependent oxidoreductase [Caulobacter segnis]|uniref:NAD(P)/FAD-dependent oxidoreductase n=1 Tax=Caulobacter segnis TaxID=88688 RepID=UPI001CBF27B0|nr:FAD-binding oxidoreductase [Caulobacter segnis]